MTGGRVATPAPTDSEDGMMGVIYTAVQDFVRVQPESGERVAVRRGDVINVEYYSEQIRLEREKLVLPGRRKLSDVNRYAQEVEATGMPEVELLSKQLNLPVHSVLPQILSRMPAGKGLADREIVAGVVAKLAAKYGVKLHLAQSDDDDDDDDEGGDGGDGGEGDADTNTGGSTGENAPLGFAKGTPVTVVDPASEFTGRTGSVVTIEKDGDIRVKVDGDERNYRVFKPGQLENAEA